MIEILKSIGSFFLDIIETVVVALAIFVVCYLFLFQPHQVKGNSMLPNFHDGEYILTDKVSYRFGEPQRGDVVVFKAPRNEEVDYIKRIIALPGEEVKVEANAVYINNNILTESYLTSEYPTYPGTFLTEGNNVSVPADSYFVLGDNRNHSSDSREWGFIKRDGIVGRAFFRYWPFTKLGLLPKMKY